MISIDKRYRTRCCYEVDIENIAQGEMYPIRGSYQGEDGLYHHASWSETGEYSMYSGENRLDLIEIEEETVNLISIDKEYITREGHKVRLYCTDADGDHPVHGAYYAGYFWQVMEWTKDGYVFHNGRNNTLDILEVRQPIKFETTIQVCRHEGKYIIYEKGTYHSDEVVGIVPITVELLEGDGL